jgi:hypothetical protein
LAEAERAVAEGNLITGEEMAELLAERQRREA